MSSAPSLRRCVRVLIAGAIALIVSLGAWGGSLANAEEPFTPLPLCEQGQKNPDGSTRSYQDYALCMAAELDQAVVAYNAGDYDTAYEQIGKAYFGWYENQLEPQSMTLPGSRKVKMEGRFARAKLALRTDPENADLARRVAELKTSIARDAMVLDGVLDKNAPESAGEKLLSGAAKEEASSATLNTVDFVTALTLLLREGLEAILVVAAIVLYLVKSGHTRLVRSVYIGAAVGIVCSFLLAFVMNALVGGAGKASELIEGITMFIAVAMLFYVSNWMLSKTAGQNWQNYIEGMVKTSVSTGAATALVFAAFLAVVREGAELVLFYTASFSGGGHSPLWIGLGFALGAAILAVVFLIFRFGGAKLPIRPIFMATSVLLFIMCISFVGKGVQELKEAGVILGTTNLPWVKYYMPELGIYPQAESLLPQLILLVASVWLIIAHTRSTKRARQVNTDN